jgi:hypothetical protein
MREVIKKAQQVPGPGEYELDMDSILARQRRIVNKAFAAKEQMRVDRKKGNSHAGSTQKRAGLSVAQDAINRLSSELDMTPCKELPSPDVLCSEILACSAAQRFYQEMRAMDKDKQELFH